MCEQCTITLPCLLAARTSLSPPLSQEKCTHHAPPKLTPQRCSRHNVFLLVPSSWQSCRICKTNFLNKMKCTIVIVANVRNLRYNQWKTTARTKTQREACLTFRVQGRKVCSLCFFKSPNTIKPHTKRRGTKEMTELGANEKSCYEDPSILTICIGVFLIFGTIASYVPQVRLHGVNPFLMFAVVHCHCETKVERWNQCAHNRHCSHKRLINCN